LQVVKVSIEVRSGAARFDVAVRASSIQRALSMVGGWYPGAHHQVKFPIDHPESFLAEDLVTQAGMVSFEQLAQVAA
jgi:hypothetical protein